MYVITEESYTCVKYNPEEREKCGEAKVMKQKSILLDLIDNSVENPNPGR